MEKRASSLFLASLSRVRRFEVGYGTNQGFYVGHKVLGDVRGLEVLGRAIECLEASMAGKSEEINVSTSVMEFVAKHLTLCMMKSKQFFVSSEVPSKTPVSSPALADKLVLINNSSLTSPARVREYFISENCLQI